MGRQRDKCRPLSPPRAVRRGAIRATSRQPPTTNAVFDALRLKGIHPVSPPNRLLNPLVTRASVERQTLLGFPHPPRHRREALHPRRPFGRTLWRKAFGLRRTMPGEASRSGASAHRERVFVGEHQSKCGREAALLHCRGAAPKVRRRAPLPIAGQNSCRSCSSTASRRPLTSNSLSGHAQGCSTTPAFSFRFFGVHC